MTSTNAFSRGDEVIANVALDYPEGYAVGSTLQAVEIPATVWCVEGDAGIGWALVHLSDDRDKEQRPADYAHIPLNRLRKP